jgi:hypothetical protein
MDGSGEYFSKLDNILHFWIINDGLDNKCVFLENISSVQENIFVFWIIFKFLDNKYTKPVNKWG